MQQSGVCKCGDDGVSRLGDGGNHVTCHYVTTVVQIMLPGQQREQLITVPCHPLAHMHAVQGKVLPTVVPALAGLAFLALSAVMEGASSLAAPEGSSALVSPLNGAVLVVCCPLACTAAGSGLASVM